MKLKTLGLRHLLVSSRGKTKIKIYRIYRYNPEVPYQPNEGRYLQLMSAKDLYIQNITVSECDGDRTENPGHKPPDKAPWTKTPNPKTPQTKPPQNKFCK